ncbi:helix-turn-helix transcriptional regulator [Celeribacter naphthalenivorans]|uniref:helix-turn-helix transcriptional regulator n=1 Tax=Celeribacter naphthalenivorans TaxID=1614694 RepID=UPI00299E2487|nr:helix-turn-helix domain-containing protein [Celeribacter naphthalenivorans]
MQRKTLLRDGAACDAIYFDDVAQEAWLPGWSQSYRRLQVGPYRAQVTRLALPGMLLARERINLAVQNEFTVPEDQVYLYFDLAAARERTGHINAKLYQPGRCYGAFLEAGCDDLMICLPGCEFKKYGIEKLEALTLSHCDYGLSSWALTLLEGVMAGYVSEKLLALAPKLALDQISAMLHDGEDPRPRGVGLERQFRDLFELCSSLPADMLTVTDIAAVSKRTPADLRHICQAVTGLRLDAMLQAWRLSAVHRVLHHAAPCEVSVTAVAMDHGFTHWGRFSAAYRDMFGVLPSETLRAPT